jgi:HlyD family secretion protein
MKTNQFTNWRRWLTLLVAIGLLAGGGYYLVSRTQLLAQNVTGQPSTGAASTQLSTVTIQPADLAQTAVSAAGNLALVSERSVALGVGGIVEEIAVAVGDSVHAGDALLKLNTTELQRTRQQAQLAVEAAKIALADLQTPATAAELAKAQAAVAEAQANLTTVQAGPSAEELAAARSTLAAAQSNYSELQAGPSELQLTQLSASLKKAEVTLAETQRAYDQVAWRNDAGMTTEAADLQSATIDYEAAKAAYDESTAPSTASVLQSALASVQNAQVSLTTLLSSPTAAEIATAQAQVAEAEATLADLLAGPTADEVRSVEITLEQALMDLETAYRNLDAATVTAPIAGVVTALNAEVGVRSAADTIVVTLADTTQLELVINVAEADMPSVGVGQEAEIEIDALPGQTFAGVVQAIAPTSSSDSGSVTYPVTVRLTDNNLAGVLPGMNAVATLLSQTPVVENSWLAPTNALVRDGDATTVLVVRGQTTVSVAVTPGKVQGEWTTVQSPELRAGDQVVGSLTSSSGGASSFGPPGGGDGMPPMGP